MKIPKKLTYRSAMGVDRNQTLMKGVVSELRRENFDSMKFEKKKKKNSPRSIKLTLTG